MRIKEILNIQIFNLNEIFVYRTLAASSSEYFSSYSFYNVIEIIKKIILFKFHDVTLIS